MLFQTYARLGLLSPVLVVAMLACGRPKPHNEVARHGDDVLASGSTPQMTDSVPGDVMLAGGDLNFSGATGGDYLGAGGNQTIGGRIHGAIRAAGGEIHVTAVVDRNVTIAGGSVEIDRAAVIGRNAYLAGGVVRVDGMVRNGLLASGRTVVLNGTVNGDVEVLAGELRVGPSAIIMGNLRYRVSDEKVHIDSAARISGGITALPVSTARGWYVLGILWMLGFLVAGAVVVALVPHFMAGAAEVVGESPGRSALVGLGWIILLPVAIILTAFTIIGLPLAFLAAAVYGTLVYLGRMVLTVWLGRRVLGARARTGRTGVLLNFGVGGLILLLVRLIPVIGPFAISVVTIVGFGALLLRIHALREAQQGFDTGPRTIV